MTYSDACSRFANLASTGISIADAVLEAVERIYEMGRFPGTTAEVVLEEDDFIFDSDVNAHFVYLDDSTYDGAIGFRSDTRGWGIVDQAVLYKDGVNAGDLDFVDYGSLIYGRESYSVTGQIGGPSGPVEFGEFIYFLTEGGRDIFKDQITSVMHNQLSYGAGSGQWMLTYAPDDIFWYNESDSIEPPINGWQPEGESPTGTPQLIKNIPYRRKYRAPMGFSPANGPYYALMKLECPEMNDDTIIQVPTGPLKSAVLAVCQEYVGDDERALLNWQKFDQFMTRSERQTHGPKKMFISFDSSLRRRPTQFM